MIKTILSTIFIFVFALSANSQSTNRLFDTIQFNQQLEFANHLIDYEFYTQQAIEKFSKLEDVSAIEWFSFYENSSWHTVGGNVTDNRFRSIHHVYIDSLNSLSEYKGRSDTAKLNTYGLALSASNKLFQVVRDTCSIYFNPFVISNPDKTLSVWYFPAFQPSGQAIYGYEWEYVFEKNGRDLLRQNSYTNILTGVWIGQPRELWLNYRNTDTPTIGSVFFAQSFRDYFTRVRIDTRISTSTTAKDANGNYKWTHKMK